MSSNQAFSEWWLILDEGGVVEGVYHSFEFAERALENFTEQGWNVRLAKVQEVPQ